MYNSLVHKETKEALIKVNDSVQCENDHDKKADRTLNVTIL